MWPYRPRERRQLGVVPRGNSPRALAPWAPANQQSPTSHPGSGLQIVGGGIDPGNFRVRPRGVGIVEIWKEFLSGDGQLSSPGTAGLGVGPRGNCRRALVPWAPTSKTITRWSWGFHNARGRMNQEISVFAAGLLELSRYGKPSYPEMRPYPPRERRQLHVGPRGNSPRAQPPWAPADR